MVRNDLFAKYREFCDMYPELKDDAYDCLLDTLSDVSNGKTINDSYIDLCHTLEQVIILKYRNDDNLDKEI